MIVRQLDGEVGAEGIGVVQALEAQRVELFLARGQQRDVLAPARLGYLLWPQRPEEDSRGVLRHSPRASDLVCRHGRQRSV